MVKWHKMVAGSWIRIKTLASCTEVHSLGRLCLMAKGAIHREAISQGSKLSMVSDHSSSAI